MVLKKVLLTAICCIFLSITFNRARAQQSNSIKENLFIHMPRSVTLTPNSKTLEKGSSITPDLTAVTRSQYRSFDGTNNNLGLGKGVWGSANIPFLREIPADYGPHNSLAGKDRPSPREISNLVVDEPVTIFNNRNVSTVNYLWGQFLDHDITLTPTGNTEPEPIPLPKNEPLFTEPIAFFRSAVYPGTGVSSVREQFNLNTAWIDASTVYGSDLARANWLRTFNKGKLKTSTGNLLPFNTLTGEQDSPIDPNAPGMANDGNKTIKTFVAGDVRASEHPVLASFHILFIREHNRICDLLVASGQLDDEKNYQTARKIVGALIQNIAFSEFLPSLGVTLQPYSGYKDNVRPDLTNIFATAGFRLGHSMVADEVLLIDNNCHFMDPESLELDELFWNPQLVVTYKPEAFLKGIAAHTQYETNIKINSVLRNLLFGDPASPVRFGVDLASLNIQRGRDHGLPDYNTVREFYTGIAAKKFPDISTNDTLADNLKSLYKNIKKVDLWTGILSEDLMPGKSIGKTVHEIQRVQFEKLRDGDFYYFENDPYLSSADRVAIQSTKLSDIIKRNTTITNLQTNVFFVTVCPGINPKPTGEIAVDILKNNDLVSQIISPNPVTDLLAINFSRNAETANSENIKSSIVAKDFTVNIYNLFSNKLLLTSKGRVGSGMQIDVSGLPQGVYVVLITQGGRIVSSEKLIINK